MPKRRSNGEGSPVPVKNGWKAIHTVGWRIDPETGKKRRITKTRTCKSRADATAWLNTMRSQREAGTESGPAVSMLFCEWADAWLKEVERDQSTSTFQAYDHHLRGFAVPALGRFPLADIKPMAIRNMLADLEAEYGGRSTLQEVYKITRICFGAAAKMELIERNPVDQVSRPKYRRKDIDPFTVAEVQEILKATEADRLNGLYVVAFHLGLRQGELYALEWRDIDWPRGKMRIERQAVNNRGVIEIKPPKTKAGRRVLDLAPEVVKSLRTRQAAAMAEGLAACPLVFPAPRGGIIQRSSFAHRTWKELLKKLGIKKRGLHHARHTFATHALTGGPGVEPCPLHVVSAILGHSSPAVTLNIYSHLIDTAQSETVLRVAKLFAG